MAIRRKSLYKKIEDFYTKNKIDDASLRRCIDLNKESYRHNTIKYDEITFIRFGRGMGEMVFIEFNEEGRCVNLLIYAALYYNFSFQDMIQMEEEVLIKINDGLFTERINDLLELNENISDDVKLWIKLR